MNYLKHIPDGDNGNEARGFYLSHFHYFEKSYFGDCIFTPIALLDDVESQSQNRKRQNPSERWSSLCSDFNNENEKVKKYKTKLVSAISQVIESRDISRDYHCLANFGYLPPGLNEWRGAFDRDKYKNNRPRLGDYPDLFLECVKTYLSNGEYMADGYDAEIEGCKLKDYDWFFKKIGDGKICSWDGFVTEMQLRGSFVTSDGEVIPLFTHSIGKPFPDLSSVFSGRKYTVDTLATALCDVPEICECIENIYTIWDARSNSLKPLSPSRP